MVSTAPAAPAPAALARVNVGADDLEPTGAAGLHSKAQRGPDEAGCRLWLACFSSPVVRELCNVGWRLLIFVIIVVYVDVGELSQTPFPAWEAQHRACGGPVLLLFGQRLQAGYHTLDIFF